MIRETWYDWGNGVWGDWIAMPIPGGTFNNDPETIATSDGHEQVFANGGGSVYESWFDPRHGNRRRLVRDPVMLGPPERGDSFRRR